MVNCKFSFLLQKIIKMILTAKQINILAEDAANFKYPEQDDDCPSWLRFYHKVQKKLNLQRVSNLLDLANIEKSIGVQFSEHTKKHVKGWIKTKSNCC